jgi:hypothetical protein
VSLVDLRTPEELLAVGFTCSRVVMLNEAHNGLKRCQRTREIGRRLLPAAHAAGVRHLAMEALPQGVEAGSSWTRRLADWGGGYLGQPEMRRLIEEAEKLGWRLFPYETRRYPVETNDREEDQARNLVEVLTTLPRQTPLLVWCGNSHLSKQQVDWWRPMASRFWEMSGIEPFSIDQTVTVEFEAGMTSAWHRLGLKEARRLEALGGTAGFLTADSPIPRPGVDAVLLSTQNALE